MRCNDPSMPDLPVSPPWRANPWLDPLRGHPRFAQILHTAEGRHREAAAAFLKAGGDRVLGLGTKL